jgi:hypothetical protein
MQEDGGIEPAKLARESEPCYREGLIVNMKDGTKVPSLKTGALLSTKQEEGIFYI